MSKRQQDGEPGEGQRVVAISKPMMSLLSKIAHRSPTLDSGATNSPGYSECHVKVQIVPAQM